ncbi:MAG: hypothetical protein KBG15_02985 [Kofleriaceae bacterium]|nr:hypothetical protein [Kofleriaceae bacterium]
MMLSKTMRAGAPATLEQVRFGEFLLERKLISDEQWLAALADHWSSRSRRSIGETIVDKGYLASSIVESQARVFHDDDVFNSELDVVVVMPRPEQVTVPMPMSMPRQIRN